MIEFFAACNYPTSTAQMKRLNRATGAFFKSSVQEDAVSTIGTILAPHRPDHPIEGAVRLTVEVTWGWLGKHKKADRAKARIPHTSRPDLDNLVKQLQDELVTWRFIESDQKVAELIVRKFWGTSPGVFIRIEQIEAA